MTLLSKCHRPAPAPAIPATSPDWWQVDVIIPVGPGGGRFLQECLQSVRAQNPARIRSVIIVDDGADLAPVPSAVILRSDARNSHQARAIGVAHGTAPLIYFLDVDNRLKPGFLEACCRKFETNPDLGIVYQDLEVFGEWSGLAPMPRAFDASALGRANFMDTGSMLLREAVEQTGVMRHQPCGFEDWWIARRITEAGWQAQWQPIPLEYRFHRFQRSTIERLRPFPEQSNLLSEEVTIFGTISRRVFDNPHLWERRVDWLLTQRWPRDQTRLVFANTSGQPLRSHWFQALRGFAGLSVYDHSLESGLETEPRINRQDIQRRVQTVVAAIYNRMLREVQTDLVLTLEDDVFPESFDLIDRLIRRITLTAAAVAVPYRLRFPPFHFGVWREHSGSGAQHPALIAVAAKGAESVAGFGFGCTLLRRSQFAGIQFQGNTSVSLYYDVDVCKRLRDRGLELVVDWTIPCDHVDVGHDHEWRPRGGCRALYCACGASMHPKQRSET